MGNAVTCFTGHRPDKLGGYEPSKNSKLLWELQRVILDHIENKAVETFINGCALGIDLWAARIVIKLKEKYPHIKLISALPCRNHPNRWSQSSKDEWQYVVDNSDEVVLVTDEEYKPYMMQVRNIWMVDKSDFVIGVYDGTSGGTKNCLDYARKRIKEENITVINPNNFR